MSDAATNNSTECRFLPASALDLLIRELADRGYEVVGPTIDQGAIVYGPLRSIDDLPQGWTDEQQPGHYRLRQTGDARYFGYVVGPHSWKKYLFPAAQTISTAQRTDTGWQFRTAEAAPVPRYAFLGVRACELAAMRIQDQVFMHEQWSDPTYSARRRGSFIVAVNCSQAASTCFCTSMNTGPACRDGYDMALTEIAGGFEAAAATPAGTEILATLPLVPLTPGQSIEADTMRQTAVRQIEKQLDVSDIRGLLRSNLNHSHWDDVAARCLSCANCTMVCPTCFCSSVEDVADLTGDHVHRERRWDSCFNPDFSYMNGGEVRNSISSRYRQWLTHKLSSWFDQFGSSGCVGCGRCITWCPPGIDLTAEVAAIRATDGRAVLPEAAAARPPESPVSPDGRPRTGHAGGARP